METLQTRAAVADRPARGPDDPVIVFEHVSLAFDDVIETVRTKDGVSADEARKRALGYLVPGLTLQPSGVFAAIRAQEAGCTYLRAS